MPSVPPLHSRFTAATAREMGAKGNAAKAARLAALRVAAQGPATAPAPDDDYPRRRLLRVRLQLDLVDQRIHMLAASSKPDGQLLNWLCQAQERLSDQERTLDGRPLPGNLRPVAARSSNAARSTSASLPSPIATPLPSSQPAAPSSAVPLTPAPIDPQRIP